jgi:hypothetical protein
MSKRTAERSVEAPQQQEQAEPTVITHEAAEAPSIAASADGAPAAPIMGSQELSAAAKKRAAKKRATERRLWAKLIADGGLAEATAEANSKPHSSLYITATLNYPLATMQWSQADGGYTNFLSGQNTPSLALDYGDNRISLFVTAENRQGSILFDRRPAAIQR